ncbi:hypothetical protein FACS1894105_07900 [Clostridia bacterium]|nr:hypothetical protein FACS1894105_07900 [Clostridia bacterium]
MAVNFPPSNQRTIPENKEQMTVNNEGNFSSKSNFIGVALRKEQCFTRNNEPFTYKHIPFQIC